MSVPGGAGESGSGGWYSDAGVGGSTTAPAQGTDDARARGEADAAMAMRVATIAKRKLAFIRPLLRVRAPVDQYFALPFSVKKEKCGCRKPVIVALPLAWL
jgi:hypothetical protein